MKYIRTPYGIYDIQNSMFYEFEDNTKYPVSHCEFYENNPDECRVSDLLAELCDQIVYNGYLYQNKITWDNCIVEDSFEELEEPITDEMIKQGIYGAIWNKWGLKYIAKLDEKGELELI